MLSGQDVLIVEAEFLIALEIQRVLEGMGARQSVFARSSDEALRLNDRWTQFRLAIVEFRHGNAACAELISGLQATGIPIVVCSADSALRRGVPGLPDATVLIKPVPEQDLASAITRVLAS